MASAVREMEESSWISPPPGSVSSATLPLSFFDAPWIFQEPVSRIFFYQFPHPTASFVDSVLPNLKSSLSLTLRHFYPLAGNLVPSPDTGRRFEIYYQDGDSVSLTFAEYEGDNNHFHQLFDTNNQWSPTELLQLVPRLPTSDAKTPLLAIQLTMFPNCGFSIGISIHHVAGDGLSTSNFIKSWALTCRSGEGSVNPPLHDRSLILDPRGRYSFFLNELLESKLNKQIESPKTEAADAVLALFTLGNNHIQSLKQWVVAKSAVTFHCSTFTVACAFVWVCLVRTQGGVSEQSFAHLGFAVDCRGRLDPPVPESYFGNCIGGCFVDVKVVDLIGENGVLVASQAIGRAIEGMKDGVLEVAEGWVSKIKSLQGEKLFSVAGSPRFGVYDIDFGWGRPRKVVVPSIWMSGAISIAESRDEDGGVEIGLVLLEHEMDEFRTHFDNALSLHS